MEAIDVRLSREIAAYRERNIAKRRPSYITLGDEDWLAWSDFLAAQAPGADANAPQTFDGVKVLEARYVVGLPLGTV